MARIVGRVDFEAVNRAALARVETVLMEWLPGGKVQGREWASLNPTRVDNSLGSFKVNLDTGRWADFATGDSGGDLVSLYAYLKKCNQVEAALALADRLRMPNTVSMPVGASKKPKKPQAGEWKPIIQVPDSAPKPTFTHSKWGAPSGIWAYRDSENRLLGYACRWDVTEHRKEILPRTYCQHGDQIIYDWRWKQFPSPRPLYGLEHLAAKPSARVIVTEGEKAADAARKLFPGAVVVTSPGGSKAAHKADWSPLKDRRVVIAPDHDESGRQYADSVAQLVRESGATEVKLLAWPSDRVITDGQVVDRGGDVPEGWDLADALEEGWMPKLVNQLDRYELFVPYPDQRPEPGADQPEGTPAGYQHRDDGLWFLSKSSEDGETWERVCSPIRVVAKIRNADSEDWGRLVEMTDPDGLSRQVPIEVAVVMADDSGLMRRLAAAGLEPADAEPKTKKRIKNYLIAASVKARAYWIKRIGWHELAGQIVFVLPDQIYPLNSTARLVFETEPRHASALRVSGTLEAWRENIGRSAVGNSRLLLVLSAALCGPLLHLVDEESGGIHLVGMSGTGKTTALMVAGSVWGGGGINGFLQSWRVTDNALESVAQAHCDLCLVLDEMGQVDGRQAGDIVYMVASGTGKGRAKRDGSGRPRHEWRVPVISSGEVTLANKVSEGGRRIKAGQQVRLIDLPIDSGANMGAFENIHKFETPEAFARYLKEVSTKYYGTPGRAFLDHITTHKGGLPAVADRVRRVRKGFVDRVVPQGSDPQVQRVAGRFGVFSAAGLLAVEAGIAPWTAEDVADGIIKSFDSYLAFRGSTGPAEIKGALDAIRSELQVFGQTSKYPIVKDGRLMDNSDQPARPPEIRGYRKRAEDGTWRWLIHPERLKHDILPAAFPTGLNEYLVEMGYVDPGENHGKPSATKTTVIPGESRRCKTYHFNPTTLDDDPEPGENDEENGER
ncbi:MAG: DUF927 domain-containing protein [Proteobacteria bacterium]|nr:DUF927 domain-containing protein [Pseudomonadota bacterium]